MLKKPIILLIALILLVSLVAGCGNTGAQNDYIKYRGDFFDTFDTVVTVMAYAHSQEEFDNILNIAHENFLQLHKLFDIYHNYDGINNIKTINDNAGIAPVKADPQIIDLIKLSKEWYGKTDGLVNIALGPVLKIWHDYREAGIDDPKNAKLPPMDKLEAANQYTDIDKVIIDETASTVYLEDKNMCLDVGAVAKGYATEAVAQVLEKAGYDSVLISAGGNVRAIGHPLDGKRGEWNVGIKNPDSPLEGSTDESNLLDIAKVTDMSVVSSGVYERYYTVDGKQYHHIIDPDTLMPSNNYIAVTVIVQDSGLADLLSTALFLMPPDESLKFAENLDGVEALWVMPDRSLMFTSGMKQLLRDN